LAVVKTNLRVLLVTEIITVVNIAATVAGIILTGWDAGGLPPLNQVSADACRLNRGRAKIVSNQQNAYQHKDGQQTDNSNLPHSF
jgi:hypothetical protein